MRHAQPARGNAEGPHLLRLSREVRRLLLTGGAIVALLLAGVLMDSARAAARDARPRAQRGEISAQMSAYTPAFLPGAPVQAAVVLQLSDCTGNLRLLDLLNRPEVSERLRLAVLWYAGPVGDSAGIRRLLPNWSAGSPLRPVPAAVLGELRRLGHRHTPLLIVMDQEGRVRLTSQSPRSPREFAGLRRVIEGLTWIEEL